jgi:hypothetical protein
MSAAAAATVMRPAMAKTIVAGSVGATL